jgi:hypothetical protein
VRVAGGQLGGSLGSELIELNCGDTLVHTLAHLLSNRHRVDILVVQPITQFLDAACDLVKMNALLVTCA